MRRAFILDAWDRGDELARRNLLAYLFEELHVQEGMIVGPHLEGGTRPRSRSWWKLFARVAPAGFGATATIPFACPESGSLDTPCRSTPDGGTRPGSIRTLWSLTHCRLGSAEQAVSPLLGGTRRVLHIRRVDRTHER